MRLHTWSGAAGTELSDIYEKRFQKKKSIALDDGGDTLAACSARGYKCKFLVLVVEAVGGVGQETNASGAEGVPDRQ